MSYSDLYFKSKKKQGGLLFIIALFSIIGFIGFVYGSNSLKTSKAEGSKLPESPKIVNLRTTQAGIFWKSDKQEIGWIMYGKDKNNLNRISYDDRDTESIQKPYLYHYVFLIDLVENQKYFFKIYSKIGNNILSYSDGGSNPFSFMTPKNISLKQTVKPAYGRVLQQNNLPVADAFVIFMFNNYYPLLAVTKLSGEFMIPLNNLVEKTTNNIVVPKLDEKTDIRVLNNQQQTKIIATLAQTNPFSQSIVLGKDYDFSANVEVLGVSSINQPVESAENGNNFAKKISILYPKENSVVVGQKPLIKGTALPNKTVFITINSKPEYNFRSIADIKGEWKVITPLPIESGSYVLTMTTTDEKGKEVVIKRQFIIAKSGEQVLGEATAEPTLTTELPTPTTGQFFTPTSVPPTPGISNNFLVVVSSSLVIFGLGILLVF